MVKCYYLLTFGVTSIFKVLLSLSSLSTKYDENIYTGGDCSKSTYKLLAFYSFDYFYNHFYAPYVILFSSAQTTLSLKS